ncbi:hypothetical protein GCM10007973_24920 [Polymorphobacter multimanifer]|uniref:DUF885 family protein n=1 Tax=Polymorphobacter multimanifer TaxID=1070431 RepID=UPI00166BEE64|nr:DUF885 family protein [Polymorphobacter multimanifer]GGI87450.1 hypothetical protein GCM10007973_24920 [Polymorphobacter multimanifer]
MLDFRTALAVSVMVAAPLQAQQVADHAALVDLYKGFRAAAEVPVSAGVADHGPQAMAARAAMAQTVMQRLEATDDSAWPVKQRADLMLVLAEARSVWFEQQVLRPFARDPSWYATLALGWGPKISTAIPVPTYPLRPAATTAYTRELPLVPARLAAARRSLTEMKGDLVTLGLTHHGIETRVYGRMARELAKSNPALAKQAAAAERASADFVRWLEAEQPKLPKAAGVGKAQLDWYLRYALLFPWGFDDMKLLGRRELERTWAFLKMEEHEHRDTPMLPPVTTLADFEAMRTKADIDLLKFLKEKKIFTVPDWLAPPEPEVPYVMPVNRDPAVPGPFDAPIRRGFFRETEDREPRTLRAHNLPGHQFDSMWRRRSTDPIRADTRLNFIDSSRIEGWAFYLEELVTQAGWLDDGPKAREISYILLANRAARLWPELLVHSGEWDYTTAVTRLATDTPMYMTPQDDTANFDMTLYLRQPGLGLNYYFGKLQIEQLLTDVAMQQGKAFNLTKFHDDFIARGLVPIALTRWEMTGLEDQIKPLRKAPPIPKG